MFHPCYRADRQWITGLTGRRMLYFSSAVRKCTVAILYCRGYGGPGDFELYLFCPLSTTRMLDLQILSLASRDFTLDIGSGRHNGSSLVNQGVRTWEACRDVSANLSSLETDFLNLNYTINWHAIICILLTLLFHELLKMGPNMLWLAKSSLCQFLWHDNLTNTTCHKHDIAD